MLYDIKMRSWALVLFLSNLKLQHFLSYLSSQEIIAKCLFLSLHAGKSQERNIDHFKTEFLFKLISKSYLDKL